MLLWCCVCQKILLLISLLVCIHTMYSFLVSSVPPDSFAVWSSTSPWWERSLVALLFISISLRSGCCSGWPTAFLIWWWAVKWPACPHNWVAGARVGFQGFPYRAVSRVGWMILYTHPNPVTHIHSFPLPTRRPKFYLLNSPWHCPMHHHCPWVSWDARNNWWWCRSLYLSRQGGRHFFPPPAEGYCPATSIYTDYFKPTAAAPETHPFTLCH